MINPPDTYFAFVYGRHFESVETDAVFYVFKNKGISLSQYDDYLTFTLNFDSEFVYCIGIIYNKELKEILEGKVIR